MTIRDVVDNLASFPDSATIFAERLQGEFRADSRARVLELSEAELRRPISDVARERTPGLDYFLEVFVAREVVDAWGAETYIREATPEPVGAVIYYAENDAYPALDCAES